MFKRDKTPPPEPPCGTPGDLNLFRHCEHLFADNRASVQRQGSAYTFLLLTGPDGTVYTLVRHPRMEFKEFPPSESRYALFPGPDPAPVFGSFIYHDGSFQQEGDISRIQAERITRYDLANAPSPRS